MRRHAILATALLAACATPPSTDMVDVPAVPPMVRLLHGRTACLGYLGVNPLAVPQRGQGPRVGREWRCLFTTSACPIPDPPADWLCFVATSTRPMPAPLSLTPFHAPGCWLLVNPDTIVNVPHGWSGSPSTGQFLREGGNITFIWTPTPDRLGHSQFFQFGAFSPTGFLASPGVEVTVGSP